MLKNWYSSSMMVFMSVCAACSSQSTTTPPAAAPRAPAPSQTTRESKTETAPRPDKEDPSNVKPQETQKITNVSAAEKARARKYADYGTKLYREGDYTGAEEYLKQAMTIYPFMADANLILAKVLLIRASASRDVTLYANARLMLEMARALNPGSREIEQLLELVRQPAVND